MTGIESACNFTTISQIVGYWAAQAPDRVALVEGVRTFTYGELYKSIGTTAGMLQRAGVRPGDRVMIVCENCRETVVIFFAIACIDAWPVIVNARLSDREIDDIRDHSDARLAVYTIGASRHARAHGDRHGAVGSDLSALGQIAIGPLNKTSMTEAIDIEAPQRVAALIYTTGTTGRPKGVMLTHGNLLFVAGVSSAIRKLNPDDRVYAVLPMSHILGLTGVLVSTLLCGAQVHLVARFDPAVALAAFRREGITIVIGTPAMYSMLVEYAVRKKIAPIASPSLRLISSAGAPLDTATKAVTENTFHLTLHNGYGITETSPTLTLTRLETPRADCSVGRMVPGVAAKLVGSNGLPVAPGETGELFVRGPGVMKGYYKALAETEYAIDREGWFRTGDLARIEDDHFFIVGRNKEMIIRFGFNVYPAEIESVLNAHPDVICSAVLGRKAEGGEEILAFVELKGHSSATSDDLAKHAARQLAAYKRPSKYFVVAALPLSPAGKIIKSALPALAETLAGVSVSGRSGSFGLESGTV